MSFKDLKKKSGSFEKLQAELEKVNNPVTSFNDDRFWKPELDKSGNGYAVILCSGMMFFLIFMQKEIPKPCCLMHDGLTGL